ncbi:hypothetical protein RclHR1_00940007 [Rhizophagus clarus]|uniref:Uncharacterized protein n=1 Tax=Rhizophagus clarus TaxID=94130 RepID=A0A2Z6S4K8_9GLOM|nr:hypothetical protein RclHR1_00940007 [Rhizophagus clarus]GES82386.1 hypothetical protein GLOIN_2v1788493 [Rhizophagus clarus]
MLKLITYYRSNTSYKFAFYGKGTKRNSQKFSNSELNTIINKALAEWPELEDDDNEIATDVSQDVRRTTDRHIIPSHRVMVWIKNTLELSSPKILNRLENVREFLEEEGEETNDNVDGNNQNDNEVAGRGILNYNVNDLAKEFED